MKEELKAIRNWNSFRVAHSYLVILMLEGYYRVENRYLIITFTKMNVYYKHL